MRHLPRHLVFPLVIGACIEPFNARVPDGQQAIVVDGMITDQAGPYVVKIFRAAALNNAFDMTAWTREASVRIEDDLGASELLTETSPGNYVSGPGLSGVVGRSYQLKITTKDGVSYESSVEKLLPVGDFSNLRYQFEQRADPRDETPGESLNGFNVFLDADVLPEQERLVRWRWSGTFEIKTNPELRVKLHPGAVISWDPDPYPCSGYVVPPFQTQMFYKEPCTCCYCWVTQYNQAPLLADPRFISNNQISQYNIAYVPATNEFFFDKYYLEVEQMSSSQVVFEFWKRVSIQNKQGSDLFQTPPAVTTGNIQLVSGKGPSAVGVFAAASIKKHAVVIHPSDIPYLLTRPDSVALSCTELYPISSTTKPPFW